MPHYIVLSKLNPEGKKRLLANPSRLKEIEEEIRATDARVVEQWALLGEYDFCAIVEAPDNRAIHQLEVDQASRGTVRYRVLPAIDLPVFIRLLGQTTETVGPHRWQIRWPAQVARRMLRGYAITRHVNKWCKPLNVYGRERLDGFKGPAIFIANHSSHLDSLTIAHTVPRRFQGRLAFGAAADRWFIKGRKGITKQPWWNSLALNSWPIKRGGGRSSLEYGEWLLDRGWSLMIFPEGTRTTTGRMGHFKNGVALIALAKNVPVVPVYMEGLRAIRPKGAQAEQPGPVTVVFGEPIRFPPGTEVSDATYQMYKAMEALQREAKALHTPRTVEEPVPPPMGVPASGG